MDIFVDIGMATGPVLGYIHQYFLIKMQKSVGTFSIDICGILLFANILRLNFYLFNKYQLALFFQSLIMITAQILLVHICTKYAGKKSEVKLESPSASIHPQYEPEQQEKIWRWTNFSSYFIFIAVFAFSTLTISIIFKQLDFQPYGVLIGLVALLSESILILPQLLQNIRRQSTKGLSRILVVLNLSGDIFKLIYFLMKSQAFQFIMCGIIQVILDSFVVLQIFYYGRLEEQKFVKENKSLIIDKKKPSSQKKPQSEAKLDEIEMKDIDQLTSQREDSLDLETSYVNNQQSSRIDTDEFHSSEGVPDSQRESSPSIQSDSQGNQNLSSSIDQ